MHLVQGHGDQKTMKTTKQTRIDCPCCLGRKILYACRCFIFACHATTATPGNWWERCPTVELVQCWECNGTGRQKVTS